MEILNYITLFFYKRLIVLLLLTMLSFHSYGQLLIRSVWITTGYSSWTVNPQITEAGDDYISPIESIDGQLKISLAVPILSASKITLYRDNINWHDDLVLSIKRTNQGIGLLCAGCELSGGFSYTPITTVNSTDAFITAKILLELFAFNDINLQLRLSGLSVKLPAKTYSTTIYFTISASTF